MSGYFGAPFPVDPGQAAFNAARDAAETERIAAEQIALDVDAWTSITDLDAFVLGGYDAA
jgi:hypothetical protein